MEGNDKSEAQKKEDLVIPLMILTFLACAWFVYIYESRTWITTLQQTMSWIVNPTITYSPVQIQGIPIAFLATIEVLILGIAASRLVLPKEKDAAIRFITTIGLGLGLAALVSLVLGIFGNLYRLPLNVAILLLCIAFLSLTLCGQRGNERRSLKKPLIDLFSLKGRAKLPHFSVWSLAYIAIGVVFFLCFYHSLLTIVVHWDSTVYHAVMSVLMFNDNSIPLIAGPSIGIEMSANFPPLFSALGGYFYIQIGAIEDTFLRAIPPIMGILTVIATYKIGDVLAGKKYGLISALFLAMTPLFFRYSVYATSYSTLTFFCTVSVLFMMLAITKKTTGYWLVCGLFYGFALLTSYMALYLAPFFVIALIYLFARKENQSKVNIKNVSALILPALIVGGIWYFRNWMLLGNPIYPNLYTVLGGINIDPLIMETTFQWIKLDGITCFFGGEVPFFEKALMFLIYRTHFPAISLLTILGIALLFTRDKKFWLIATWPVLSSLLILSGLTWAFPRHVMFALPGFALLSALPILKALEECEEYDKKIGYHSESAFSRIRKGLPPLHKSDIIRMGLVLILFAAFLFPSLTLSFGGKLSMDNHLDQPPEDYLWLLENPNGEKWSVLTNLYPEAVGWKWLDENLKKGEKVASIENRIYYVKNSSNDYFFYLDGWEARQLYNITDPAAILQFLQKENVKYVLDDTWAHETGHFDILPMTQFLGSAYFPKILDGSGNPDIYSVGPVENPLTADSSVAVSINQDGWSERQIVDGAVVQSVIAGNDSARLLVATPNLTSVKITYLDVGSEFLSINLRNPYSGEWVYGYANIQKKDTGKWKTFEFLTPLIDEGFSELALHAYTENFTISKIVAAPFQAQGRCTLSSLESKTANATVPPTLMVYLPMLHDNETFRVQTDSYGKEICIEIFEGVIQPWEITGWWRQHELVLRSPNSTVYGQVNPLLIWNSTKSGLYTMVIVPRERDFEETRVALQVSVGGNVTR